MTTTFSSAAKTAADKGRVRKDMGPVSTKKPTAGQEPEAASTVLVDDSKMYSPDSERLIVAKVLHPETTDDIRMKLLNEAPADAFYLDQNANIWRIMCSLRDENMVADFTAVMDRANASNDFIGGTTYLGELLSDPIVPKVELRTIEQALARVKEFSLMRQLAKSLNANILKLHDGTPFNTVLSMVEDDVTDMRGRSQTSKSGPQLIATTMDAVIARLEASASGEKTVMTGIPSGFPCYDKATGGLGPGTLIILAARPSMGKTTLALNMCENVALTEGRPVLIFSLETNNATMTQRMLARRARVPMHNIRMGEIEEDWWSRIIEGVESFRDARIWLDDTPGLTMQEIRSRSRNFIAANPGGVIMLDFIQIVSGSDKESSDQRVLISNVSSGLKGLARELNAPVIALSQLNRGVEQRTNKRPMMSDLRDSGTIEQDADIIMFIYRDEYYNPESTQKGVAEIIIAKNKDGPTTVLPLAYEGALMNFQDTGMSGGNYE